MPAVDAQNRVFWNECCGANLAAELGIEDDSRSSLSKFDEQFFDNDPWFYDHVPLGEFAGRQVLEVGLGYGSLAQKIAEAGARLTGLDIADGPVRMLRHRLVQSQLPGHVVLGSILDAPFAAGSFDHVVAIGCLHHTGDMKRAIDECWRLLRPGGSLIFMVYYAYSYRRWYHDRRETLNYLWSEALGYRGVVVAGGAAARAHYDTNTAGNVAPYTDFVSVRSLRHLFERFSSFRWKRQNITHERPFHKSRRERLIKTRWPDLCGLEIWGTGVK